MLTELGIDPALLTSLISRDVHRMVTEFAAGPHNRDVYWLALYADPVAADLLVAVFTEGAWHELRHSPAYAGLDDRSLNAPFDGLRWSSGDCPIRLAGWSEELSDTCAILAADQVQFLAGRPLTEGEESELWSEIDDVVLNAVAELADSEVLDRLHRTPSFFVSSCSDEVQADSLARRVRQSIGPVQFGALFPHECSLPPGLEPAAVEPLARTRELLVLAQRLATGELWDRWSLHSPTLTGLEDELVAAARGAPGALEEIRRAVPSSTINWIVAEALISAVHRVELTGTPELGGW